MTYTAYNSGHDEMDNSARMFREWLSSRNPEPEPEPEPEQGLYCRVVAPPSFGHQRTLVAEEREITE